MNRTGVDSDSTVELIVFLSKVAFYDVHEELIPMMRADVVLQGVERFELNLSRCLVAWSRVDLSLP